MCLVPPTPPERKKNDFHGTFKHRATAASLSISLAVQPGSAMLIASTACVCVQIDRNFLEKSPKMHLEKKTSFEPKKRKCEKGNDVDLY